MQTWKHALRQLRRNPAFTAAALISLALGIGANTAMFTLANAVLLRKIPVADPDRLIRIATDSGPGGAPGAILSSMADLIQRERLFDGLCGFLSPLSTVSVDGRVTQMASHALTGQCFTTLGIHTVIGRPLTEADDQPNAAKAVVLAYETWRRDFNGNATAIGRTMRIEGGTFTIVGVAERGFTGLMVGYPEKLFIPFAQLDLGVDTPPREMLPMEVFARLPRDATVRSVTARLTALWPHFLDASVPAQYAGPVRDRYLKRRLIVTDAATGVDYSLRPRFQKPLVALLAISGIVLLVTCVNVANLLLARGAQRRREAVVRTALGASRWNLACDALAESALLLVAGAAAGVTVSMWIDRLLVAMFSANAPTFAIDVAPDARVLGFTCLVSVIAFAVFAIVPTLASSRVDASALGAASRRVIGHRDRPRQIVIIAQVSLTMVLTAAGSAFVQELRRLQTEPLGLNLERVISAQLSPVPGGYQPPFAGGTYFPQILEQIAAIPGVRSVAFSRSPVLGGQLVFVPVAVARSEGEVPIEQMIVSDEFFSTLGIPLTTGSPFEKNGKPSDVRRTAILSESGARALFGTAPVVGRQIRVGNNPLNQSLEIVGVAADAVMSSPQRRNVRVVYLNFWQWGNTIQGWADLVVRTDHDPVATADVVRRTVAGAGHEYVSHLHELTDQRDIALSQERLLATLSTAFGTLGLTLAAIGLYGILTFSVAQRTGEIGIRMALGADRMRVLALVLRDAAALVGVGILVGAPLAWAANSLAAPTLYGRTSTAIMPVATALVLMLIVSLMAVWLPARRASSIDPMQALRRE